MNRFNIKKTILVIIFILFFVSIACYFVPRYGWKLFGFKFCADPSTIAVTNITIDYNEDFVELIGYDVYSSASAYVGTIHKLNGATLFVGMKFNFILGFFNRVGEFGVHIPVDTQKIEKIILKGNQAEITIWEKGDPAPDPQEWKVGSIIPEDEVLTINEKNVNQSEIRYITLNDVRLLASKGNDLSVNDLRNFIGNDIGSGLHIPQYIVEDEYILLVGHGGGDPIFYTIFGRASEANEWSQWPNENYTIDIRYYDVDRFIKNGTRELVRPYPSPNY